MQHKLVFLSQQRELLPAGPRESQKMLRLATVSKSALRQFLFKGHMGDPFFDGKSVGI